MKTRNQPKERAAKTLYAASVQYGDGRVSAGRSLDLEKILTKFSQLELDRRADFLCLFAHDLTVSIRGLLWVDGQVPETDIDQVKWLNEYINRLTSCVNDRQQWSASDMTLRVREIVESSFQHGLDRAVGAALAHAAGLAVKTKESVAAK
jgi:hypothetical protein